VTESRQSGGDDPFGAGKVDFAGFYKKLKSTVLAARPWSRAPGWGDRSGDDQERERESGVPEKIFAGLTEYARNADCRLPIADWRLAQMSTSNSIGNRQSAIGNSSQAPMPAGDLRRVIGFWRDRAHRGDHDRQRHLPEAPTIAGLVPNPPSLWRSGARSA
jgi:hypothetical protein